MAQLRQTRKTALRRQVALGRLCLGMAVLVCMNALGFDSLRAADKPRKRTASSTAQKNDGVKTVRIQSEKNKPAVQEHPLAKPLKLVRRSRRELQDVKDYTATFSKKERLGRRGSKMLAQTMKIKFREKPFSVYFYFQDRKTSGREVLFVNGRNQGKLLVHEGSGLASLVGTLSFAPTAGDVMKENRYPITEVGLKNMAEKIIQQWEGETKYGETTVKYYNNAKLGSVECIAIESKHPQPRRQFKYHMTRVYIDKKSKLLVRVEQYGFPNRTGQQPQIIEEYTYSNINTNAGLTDFDFDRRNKSYSF